MFFIYTMRCLALIVRYLNEPFLDEFVQYYLSEGIDNIFILYDIDSTIPISDKVKTKYNKLCT